jgi:hypothetical protein
MNWLFEAYSNVYRTAMLQDVASANDIATAKDGANDKRSSFLGHFRRR